MARRKTDMRSASDLFATLERSSSVRLGGTSSEYFQSSSSEYLTRAKLRQRPTANKPGFESIIKNMPDFSSFERHNLLVESDQSKENDPGHQNSVEMERKICELSMEDKKGQDVEAALPCRTISATERSHVFCSTPGPMHTPGTNLTANKALKSKEVRRIESLGSINATPIPCPELIVEASPMSNSIKQRYMNSPWMQLKESSIQNIVRSSEPSLHEAFHQKPRTSTDSDDHALQNALRSTKSGAFVKRLTRRFRIDNLILNQSYWELFEAGDAKATLLKICGQTKLAKFSNVFTPYRRRNLRKIGEGCFGEVFRCPARLNPSTSESVHADPDASEELVAVKLVPVEGSVLFNGDSQKTFSEVLSEVIVAKELTALSYGFRNQTDGFVQLKKVHLVSGSIPLYLVRAWEAYDRERRSENDHPRIFPKSQRWLVIEMLFSGSALEDNVPPCPAARLSILRQVALSLAVAESELQFEHRDLHWGNVLVRTSCPTQQPITENDCPFCTAQSSTLTATYRLDNQPFLVPTHGVHAAIIDFTLSRLEQDGGLVYVDLSTDPTLFESHGDYQFDVYRLMRAHNGNQWKKFSPKTNVMWLHYLATKLLLSPSVTTSGRADNPCHASNKSQLCQLEVDLSTLSYKSVTDLVSRHSAFSAIRA